MSTLSKLILLALFIVCGCSYAKSGKEIGIDSPLKESRTKQSLSKARQDVEESRRDYDKCMSRYSQDETKCQTEKKRYDEDVETYTSLQAK